MCGTPLTAFECVHRSPRQLCARMARASVADCEVIVLVAPVVGISEDL